MASYSQSSAACPPSGDTKSNGRNPTETEFRISRAACRLRMMNDKGLSDGAARLGYIILECADHNSPDPFPGEERLAELTGKDKRTIRRLIKELVTRGHLVIVEVGGKLKKKNSVYRMGPGGQKCPTGETTKSTSSRTFLSKTVGQFCPDAVGQKCPTKGYSMKKGTPEESNLKSESDADASPRSPDDDLEEAPAFDQDISEPYRYRPNIVTLRAVPIATGKPEIKPAKLATPIDGDALRPKDRYSPKLATSEGRRVGNGHNGSAGKRSRGAGRTTLPEDWRLSQADYDFVKAEGYRDEAIGNMGKKFRAHYVANGDTAASWSAMWKKWVLREPSIRGGERKGEPKPKYERLDDSII
jgi:hypothetical protein